MALLAPIQSSPTRLVSTCCCSLLLIQHWSWVQALEASDIHTFGASSSDEQPSELRTTERTEKAVTNKTAEPTPTTWAEKVLFSELFLMKTYHPVGLWVRGSSARCKVQGVIMYLHVIFTPLHNKVAGPAPFQLGGRSWSVAGHQLSTGPTVHGRARRETCRAGPALPRRGKWRETRRGSWLWVAEAILTQHPMDLDLSGGSSFEAVVFWFKRV